MPKSKYLKVRVDAELLEQLENAYKALLRSKAKPQPRSDRLAALVLAVGDSVPRQGSLLIDAHPRHDAGSGG